MDDFGVRSKIIPPETEPIAAKFQKISVLSEKKLKEKL